jgi:hypothetical protein
MVIYKSMREFCELLIDLQNHDSGVNIGVAGETGIGKSCFLSQVMLEHGKLSKRKWTFDNMTWSRKELMTWIDGENKKDAQVNGVRKGQLPEFSGIIADELYAMFCGKNWFNEEQIDAVSTFNSCRDRHLLIGGSVPNFWQLDSSFTDRIHFYVYIESRGIAWVFNKENNPFVKNQWNPDENKKIFRKHKNPYKCPNFLCEIRFYDWDEKTKEEYYKIRNEKRLMMSKDLIRHEKYGMIKEQRNKLMLMLFKMHPELPNKAIAELIDMTPEAISMIRNGVIT